MMKKTILLLLVCLSNGWLFANHWTPDDSTYEDNMTLTGVVQINGVEQQSTTLEVGVFCGEECRGSGMLTYFFPTQRYVVQLLIFGEAGDQLTFKLYDHAIGQELDLTSPDAVTFTANGYGSLGNQYVLNFGLSTVTQTISLAEGWNWFSTYIEITNPIEILQMLEEALGDKGLQIKNSNISTEYDSEWGWFGDLDEVGFTNEEMIMIKTDNACTFELQGEQANPANHPITINPGWNWIGYPCAEAMTLNQAFSNFTPEEGDQIKNSEGSSEYDAEWGWFGDVENLVPGHGFMYYSSSAVAKTLLFQVGRK